MKSKQFLKLGPYIFEELYQLFGTFLNVRLILIQIIFLLKLTKNLITVSEVSTIFKMLANEVTHKKYIYFHKLTF